MLRRPENILAIVALSLIGAGCILILAPFLSAVLWAAIVCFSTWRVYERLLQLLRGKTHFAAAIMTLMLAAVLLIPFIIVGTSLGDNIDHLSRALSHLKTDGFSTPPEWVAGLPVVGPRLDTFWRGLEIDSTQAVEYAKRLATPVSKWLLGAGLAFGTGLLHLTISVLTAYFLYRDGTEVAARMQAGMERIAGVRAHHLIGVAGNTVKGVVYGIIGACLAQGVLAGFGFWIAGVPGPALLGLLTFFLALLPIGPPLIWVPATLWLFNQGQVGWSIFMLTWGIVAISGVDNIIKPYLISQGSAMPFILVLLGVLGGLLSFGVIGIFLGPTLLAVGYSILLEWTHEKHEGARG
jgi:predicted PurR-regulated permease PerM